MVAGRRKFDPTKFVTQAPVGVWYSHCKCTILLFLFGVVYLIKGFFTEGRPRFLLSGLGGDYESTFQIIELTIL